MVVAPTAPDAPDTPVIVPPSITLPNPSGGNSYAFIIGIHQKLLVAIMELLEILLLLGRIYYWNSW